MFVLVFNYIHIELDFWTTRKVCFFFFLFLLFYENNEIGRRRLVSRVKDWLLNISVGLQDENPYCMAHNMLFPFFLCQGFVVSTSRDWDITCSVYEHGFV